MIGTEAKLWTTLSKHEELFNSLSRIESPITPGASDVEYVCAASSGWIELKTCNAPRLGKHFYLHAPFTPAQANWLLTHHAPAQSLYSYLLLAVLGPRTWKEFLLIEPQQALLLVAGWKGVTNEDLRSRPGVYQCKTLNDVLCILQR